jgi:hypothetical protein
MVHSITAGAALPIVGVILIRGYLHALPKRKADKSNQGNQSKKREKPVRHNLQSTFLFVAQRAIRVQGVHVSLRGTFGACQGLLGKQVSIH